MKNIGTDTLYFHAGNPYSFCGGYQLEVTHKASPFSIRGTEPGADGTFAKAF